MAVQPYSATAPIKALAGTEASPGITFTGGDTDTGIYSPAANQLGITTGGTSKLIIDENGSLQVVEGTKDNPAIYFDEGTGIYSPGADQVAISTNGTESLRITSDGKLGLGTSAPTSLLTVGGGSTANPAADVTIQDSTVDQYRLKLTSNNYNVDTKWLGIGFGFNNNYLKAGILAEAKDAYARTNLHFCLDGNANSDNADLSDSKMVITYGGNVGIGTTSPVYSLDVASTESISASFTSTEAESYIALKDSGTTLGHVRVGSISNELTFRAGNSEGARIDSSGRLLVGTSSESGGSLLQVNDDRIRIASSKTPASAADTGTAGEVCWDSSYIYVCTATDTWKRAALSTW